MTIRGDDDVEHVLHRLGELAGDVVSDELALGVPPDLSRYEEHLAHREQDAVGISSRRSERIGVHGAGHARPYLKRSGGGKAPRRKGSLRSCGEQGKSW